MAALRISEVSKSVLA